MTTCQNEGVSTAELQAEVASFAAGLGFSSSGFNDADFLKKGPIALTANQKRKQASNDGVPPLKKLKIAKRIPNAKFHSKFKGEGLKPDGANLKDKTSGSQKHEHTSSGVSGSFDGLARFWKPVGHMIFSDIETSSFRWFEAASQLATTSTLGHDVSLDAANVALDDLMIRQKMTEAEMLLSKVTSEYEKSRQSDPNMQWVMTARRSGTSADKVAAMTVTIQDNPIANIKTLDALLGMVASKGGKRHAVAAMDVLKELFITSLLPDRKLKQLGHQPLGLLPNTKEGATLLLLWYWEDCLKYRYQKFVKAVVEATKDSLLYLKQKAMKTVFDLLKLKPEQERPLLSALVNKLGDPERRIASSASYLLASLLTVHPNMKKVVIQEVDLLLFRPHIVMRARYYAVTFLNHLVLTRHGNGPDIAKQLIEIYFALFKTIMNEDKAGGKIAKGGKKPKLVDDADANGNGSPAAEMDSRFLSALLTGVNRAFPYIRSDDADSVIKEHTPTLFCLVHSQNFGVGVQALMLLYQVLAKNQAVSDRFYRALYGILLSPGLFKSSKIEMFLALLFKAMKADINSTRVFAFAKRLLQVALHQPCQLGCGALLLISEILKARPFLWNAVLQPAQSDDLEVFVDVEEPEETPNVKNTILESSPCNEDPEGSAEELNCAVQGLGTDEGDTDNEDEEIGGKRVLSIDISGILPRGPFAGSKESVSYDPRHRDPSYCKADHTCLWELAVLASHFHPSVSTMARRLLSGANILYHGDPTHDLALGAFLDRLAEKKPRPNKRREGVLGQSKKNGILSSLFRSSSTNSTEGDMPPEAMVFQKFFSAKALKINKYNSKNKRKKQEDKVISTLEVDDGDDFVDGDVSDDNEIDEMLEENEGMELCAPLVEETEESESEFEFDEMIEAKPGAAVKANEDGKGHYVMKSTKRSPFASADNYAHLLANKS